ncbi:hypothetical protein [Yersinia bercovieri]|uniref:hypothetical protein n=1 Tax=Yersinia bercovieri TaxID=634 RepID=UPI0011A0BF6B|nr:hypothetical protein [Yersinia bercovieri]
MNNIEELKAAATAMRLSSTMRITDEIITFRRLFTPDCALALIAQLEAAQKELGDLHNQEFQQRLANAEHQLHMKDLAIHNIKASRKAQFRKRLAAEAALSAAQKERDALREVHIGAGSNTRAAADIYFQLVEELEVPAGGSLVGVIDNLKAELSAANEKLSKPVVLPEVVVVNISGKYPIEVMYASKVKTFIKAAGFTVEGSDAI